MRLTCLLTLASRQAETAMASLDLALGNCSDPLGRPVVIPHRVIAVEDEISHTPDYVRDEQPQK